MICSLPPKERCSGRAPVNREKSPVCVSALLSCTGTQVYASRAGRLQSIVILLLVFMAEFSLFCRSLSRFIFSILKRRNSNEAQMFDHCFQSRKPRGAQQCSQRSQMCTWACVCILLLSAASLPTALREASGLPALSPAQPWSSRTCLPPGCFLT